MFWRNNYVKTSFWRNNYVFITLCVYMDSMIAYNCSIVRHAMQNYVNKWIKWIDTVSQNWIDFAAGNGLFIKGTNLLPEPISPAGIDVA